MLDASYLVGQQKKHTRSERRGAALELARASRLVLLGVADEEIAPRSDHKLSVFILGRRILKTFP